jgi:hypothetical protein
MRARGDGTMGSPAVHSLSSPSGLECLMRLSDHVKQV